MRIRKNTDKAFVALRLLSEAVKNRVLLYLECALAECLDFAEGFSAMVEWEVIDKIFNAWVDFTMKYLCQRLWRNRAGRILHGLFKQVSILELRDFYFGLAYI